MASLRTDQPNSAATGEQSKRKKPRVTIYKNDDGSYDTSSLSDEDKARLFGGQTNAAPPPPPVDAAPPVEPIDPAIIGLALNLLTSVEAAVVGNRLGIPHAQCQKVLEPKPPLDTAITGLACKVANKYGASLGPYADEIALVALVATWQIQAFTELRALVAEQAANRPAPPPKHPDADRHQSPQEKPPAPAAAPEKPASSNVVPIDLLIGAQAATGLSGATGAGF